MPTAIESTLHGAQVVVVVVVVEVVVVYSNLQ